MWAANQSPMSRITAVSRDCRGIDEERSVHSTMALFNILKKEDGTPQQRPVPQHIAVIMDGNGRWAKKRGLPRTAGHKVGAETFRNIRRDALDKWKAAKKKSEMTEDEQKDAEKDMQKLTDKYIKQIDSTTAAKSDELKSI